MLKQKRFKKAVTLLIFLYFTFGLSMTHADKVSNKLDNFLSIVDAKGQIKLPTDFRRMMVHLGSWFVPEGDASGFHDVYAEASAVDKYRSTGKWPDGATIVKELRGATSGTYTTGKNVSHANNKIKQWFVMVKDTKGRFPKNPNWGDGWGWALFKPDNVNKNVSKNYKADCLGCHAPAQKTDWLYVEGMPTLSSNH